MNFADLGLHDDLLSALAALGYEEPTPIQAESIPPIVDGRDVLGQAATGTGKTAAFALPILDRLRRDDAARKRREPTALVLVPTRELAMQVSEAVHRYGKAFDTRVVPIYGGQPIFRQLKALERGVDVVVATPGRAIDHINRGTLPLNHIEIVVLDEADEMLDMGFAEDLEAILDATPTDRQTVLFSATMPPRIGGLARRHLSDPVNIRIEKPKVEPGEAPKVRQTAYVVPRSHKPAALGRILDVEAPEAAIVFCRTRVEVDELTETLNGRGYRAEALHGGLSQEQRDRVMSRVRSTTADLLIATDVAARGLDIDHLTHVVNYDVPAAPEAYVHRIGRVGRAGREGVAITLIEPRQHRLLTNIERTTKSKVLVEPVPSVDDLRARRIEMTTANLREALVDRDDLDRFRTVVDELGTEFHLADIAAAAVRLAHLAAAGDDDEQVEIPRVELGKPRKERPDRKPADRTSTRGPGDKGRADRSHDRGRGEHQRPEHRSERGRSRLHDKIVEEGFTRLFVGTGRRNGLRAGDLVGAICGETDLVGKQIGAIDITENFSLVEVPSAAADNVIRALRGTTIKGRKTSIRRERF